MSRIIIGLDLGTTTVSGVLFDAGSRRVLRSAQRSNDAALRDRPANHAEQDADRLRALALEVMAELAASLEPGRGQRHPVDGIALTGQKHGLLCVDSGGEPLTPLISWQDQRTDEASPASELLAQGGTTTQTTLDRMLERLQDLDWRDNGCQIAHGYGAATLFWMVERARLPREAAWVCSAANWLASQLTAQPPVMDPTHAASWGVFRLVDNAWNSAFLDRLELDARLFPPVWPSDAKLAGLDPRVARSTGLPSGLPVYNALGDTQAAFLGATGPLRPEQDVGLVPESVLLFNLGTGGQVCWAVPEFEPPTAQVETRPLLPPHFLRVGASLCGGAAYAWLNRTVRSWLQEFGVDVNERAVYERLNALAQANEDVGGLRVRTTFLGMRGDGETAGSIEGITLENMELGGLARATLNGMVDELHRLYQEATGSRVPGTGTSPRYVLATGGAVHKNALLSRLIEDRVGLPMHRPAHSEVAAIGTAWLAADPGRE